LVDALNSLTCGPDVASVIESREEFDLRRYETHIEAHIQDFPVNLLDIPPLNENARKDVIWRFITVVFLAHTGRVDIWQDEQDVMVMKHEADSEGCGVLGESEEADRIEGSPGGIEV